MNWKKLAAIMSLAVWVFLAGAILHSAEKNLAPAFDNPDNPDDPILHSAEKNLAPAFTKWTSQFGGVYIPHEGHDHKGAIQIKRNQNTAPDQGWLSPAIKIEKGVKQLRLSAWMKCNSVSLGDGKSDETYNASLSLLYYDRNGKKIGPDHQMVHVCYSVRRGWKFRENDKDVPANAASVRIRFHFMRDSVGAAWASDITLTPVAQGKAAVAGKDESRDALNKPLLSGRNATGRLPFYLDNEKVCQVFAPGDKMNFFIRFRSYDKKGNAAELPKGAVFRYTVRDIHGRLIESGERALKGIRNETFTLEHPARIKVGVYHKMDCKIYTGKQLWAQIMHPFGIIGQRKFDPKSEPDLFELHGMDDLQIRMGVRRIYLIGTNPSDKVLAKAKAWKKKYGLKIYTNGLIVTTSWGRKNLDPKRKNYFFKTTEEQFRKEVRVQLRRYKGIIDYVGLMGELRVPERGVGGGWERQGGAEKSAEDQVELMRIVKEEIAKIAPGMKACAGGYFWPGFDLLIEKGIAEHADVIMFHRFCDPAETYSGLKQLHKEFKKYGKKVPEIWVDEAYTNGDAEFQVPQQYAAYMTHGVKTGDWHWYKVDFGPEKASLSKRYAERGHIDIPFPALFTYNVMVGELGGLKFVRSIFPEKSKVTAYLYERKGKNEQVLVAWTRQDVPGATLQIKSFAPGDVRVTGIRGDSVRIAPQNGVFYTGVTPHPQYIVIPGKKAQVSMSPKTLLTPRKEIPAVTDMDNDFAFGVSAIPAMEGATMKMIFPEGWKSQYKDRGKFAVRPENSLLYGQICYGRVLWQKGGKTVAQYPVTISIKPPIAVQGEIVAKKGKDFLKVTVENYGKAQNVLLNVENHITSASCPEKIVKALALPGNRNTVITFPIKAKRTPDRYPVKLSLTDRSGKYLTSIEKELTIFAIPYGTIKGKPDAALHSPLWAKVKPVIMDSEVWLDCNERYNTHPFFYRPQQNFNAWRSKDDFNVKFYQMWDENTYYFRAVVRDPKHMNDRTNVQLWSGDAIQMALRDSDNKAGTAGFMFGINGQKRVQVWRYSGNEFNGIGDVKLPCAIKRFEKEKTTVYEVYLPCKEMAPMLLKEGKVIGITSVFLNRIHTIGNNPMAMRFGYAIYGGGDGGNFQMRLER